MSFIPEQTPFVALPTALRGHLAPNQLAVLWVLQSYYPQIFPSYERIANDTQLSRSTVIRVIKQLAADGWLVKTDRFAENGQTSNVYEVRVWDNRGVNLTPPKPSVDPGCQSDTSVTVTRGGCQADTLTKTNQLKQIKPTANTVGFQVLDGIDTPETNGNQRQAHTEQVPNKTARKRTTYTEEFNAFWKQYQAIDKKASGQSKPKAAKEYTIALRQAPHSALQDALRAAVNEQSRAERTPGAFATSFPDCFRWLRDGKYEAFLENGAAGVEKPFDPRDHAPNGDDPF